MNSRVYVLMCKSANEKMDVDVFREKDIAVNKVMESIYGIDWEAQAADDACELHDEINDNMHALWQGKWVYNGDVCWLMVETRVQD